MHILTQAPSTEVAPTTVTPPHARVLAYRNPGLVGHFLKAFGLQSDEADELFSDMLKFLALEGVYAHKPYPTTPIDQAWEAFILRTQEYVPFCEEMFGRYIHHVPREAEPNGALRLMATYQ